jgi:hypothetical protein
MILLVGLRFSTSTTNQRQVSIITSFILPRPLTMSSLVRERAKAVIPPSLMDSSWDGDAFESAILSVMDFHCTLLIWPANCRRPAIENRNEPFGIRLGRLDVAHSLSDCALICFAAFSLRADADIADLIQVSCIDDAVFHFRSVFGRSGLPFGIVRIHCCRPAQYLRSSHL